MNANEESCIGRETGAQRNIKQKDMVIEFQGGQMHGCRMSFSLRQPVLVGKRRDCQICIDNDFGVSGRQLRIVREKEWTYVENMSRHGTFVNDCWLKNDERLRIQVGDVVAFSTNKRVKFVVVSGVSQEETPLDDSIVESMLRCAKESQERQRVLSCRSHEVNALHQEETKIKDRRTLSSSIGAVETVLPREDTRTVTTTGSESQELPDVTCRGTDIISKELVSETEDGRMTLPRS